MSPSLVASFSSPLLGIFLLVQGTPHSIPSQTVASAPASGPELVRMFDQAQEAAIGVDLAEALDLYRKVAESQAGDRGLRNRAAIQGAFLEWHVFENAERARTLLAIVASTDAEA